MTEPRAFRRRAVALLVALLIALVATSALPVVRTPRLAFAALPTFFPTQSLGDRGTDVTAIQHLIRHHQSGASSSSSGGRTVRVVGVNPIVVPVDGVFRDATAAGVRAFQVSRGLPATGVVDHATWERLVVPLGPFATNPGVVALQTELTEKRGAVVGTDGVYGAQTVAAVRAFQQHMGLPATGSVDTATWRALLGHFELPRFSSAALCDYDPPANANWGTAETIASIETAGAAMVGAGYGRVAVGDVSYEHGGDHPEHVSHEVGLDADLRPMRKANDQCSLGSNWRLAAYDRAATRALIKAIRAATPGHVKKILFNDPQLIAERLTVYQSGHDDHLHVRLCEASHPQPLYVC